MRMTLVVAEGEILVAEVKQIPDLGVERDLWQSKRCSLQLLIGLLKVIAVQMCITQGMDEFASLQTGTQFLDGLVMHHSMTFGTR